MGVVDYSKYHRAMLLNAYPCHFRKGCLMQPGGTGPFYRMTEISTIGLIIESFVDVLPIFALIELFVIVLGFTSNIKGAIL